MCFRGSGVLRSHLYLGSKSRGEYTITGKYEHHYYIGLNIKAIVTAVRGRILTHTKQAVSDYLYVPADDI